MMKKAIIADDHAIVRSGLKLIFEERSKIEIVDECQNGNELLIKIREKEYDVVILDVMMPGKEALDVLKDIKLIKPSLPVVIFSMNPEKNLQLRMFRNGASAFINKEEDPAILIEAIRSVLSERKTYFTREQIQFFSTTLHEKENKETDHENLSDREFQVMCLLANGIKKTDIASKLNVSKNTINNHRQNILRKMKINNNAELTRYAIENNLIR